jgi:hypothetical protein
MAMPFKLKALAGAKDRQWLLPAVSGLPSILIYGPAIRCGLGSPSNPDGHRAFNFDEILLMIPVCVCALAPGVHRPVS